MIAFQCPSCGKSLKVKDELAGKKVKCPGCGKPLGVPQPAASVSPPPSAPADERTLPPKAAAPTDERTLPPKGSKESLSEADAHTNLGAGQAEATQAPTEKPNSELTDFLAPAEQPDELGRLGGFRILKILGHGGMGVVFLGEDPKLGRKVAIKAMLPDLAESKSAQQRFLREAKAAAALEHDHIVAIHHVGEERGAPFIVMPFLQGEPLDQRLKRDKTLPVADVVRIGRETAEGLLAAHEKGMIHRDIKPANIWLESVVRRTSSGGTDHGQRTTDYRVKILDFGLARATSDGSGLTQTGAIVGTPHYMAPEQAAGKKNIDHRCDLFSLGCVLCRMATGQLPFKGDDMLAIISSLAMDKPKEPSKVNKSVPQPLSNLIMHLLAKNPDDRPQSAAEVAEALAQLVPKDTAQMPAKGGKTALLQRPPGTPGRRKWALVGGGVFSMIVLALVIFSLTNRERQRPENETKQAAALPPTFTNSLGMEFVLVPKGKSWLGGGGGKPGDKEVEIKEDFYLGKYEVTQEEWEKIMGSNPSYFSRGGDGKDAVKNISDLELKRFPVEQVSWDDAQLFLGQLNKPDRQEDWVYRLPTEVEWEYACRGGPSAKADSADFYLDVLVAQLQPEQANFEHGKALKRTSKVGSYPPNRLGLYDMHGNVWEWCEDFVDPKDQKPASPRVMRGGSWNRDSGNCRAANRIGHRPSLRSNNLGLRLARAPIGKEILKILNPQETKPAIEPKAFTNSLGMEFVLVPKGKSWLGGGGGKPGDKEVEITEDFYLGKYEVTQEEWQKVIGKNPSNFSRGGGGKDAVKNVSDAEWKRFPVEMVSWDDAQLFLDELNKRDNQKGWVYRLPVTMEWEYACRGGPMSDKFGSAFDFYFDKPMAQLLPGQANFEHANGLKRTCKVGNYQPNRLGLYDMHGNVWEWCDEFNAKGGASRINRGGSWACNADGCRAGWARINLPPYDYYRIGLRLARVPVGKDIVKVIGPEENKPVKSPKE